MIKIIFLDIDGVIATSDYLKGGKWALNPRCQMLLGEILEKTGAKIVLSSSWRKDDLEETKAFMEDAGFWFAEEIIGITIRAYDYLDPNKKIHLSIPRGVEIKQWIDTHIHSENGKKWKKKKIGEDYNYVILDDNTDMLLEQAPYFIQTDKMKGLSEKDVLKAIRILNRRLII
jgi:hypothetical protein